MISCFCLSSYVTGLRRRRSHTAAVFLLDRAEPSIMIPCRGDRCALTINVTCLQYRIHNSYKLFYQVEEIDPAGPRAYHGTAVLGYCIYVIGGFDGMDYFNSCRCFDAVTKIWREVSLCHPYVTLPHDISTHYKHYNISKNHYNFPSSYLSCQKTKLGLKLKMSL